MKKLILCFNLSSSFGIDFSLGAFITTLMVLLPKKLSSKLTYKDYNKKDGF